MDLYFSIAVDSFRTPHSMACLDASGRFNSGFGGKTFSCQSSERLLPFHKPRAVLNVLVVSRSFLRANHSLERWAGGFDGVS